MGEQAANVKSKENVKVKVEVIELQYCRYFYMLLAKTTYEPVLTAVTGYVYKTEVVLICTLQVTVLAATAATPAAGHVILPVLSTARAGLGDDSLGTCP